MSQTVLVTGISGFIGLYCAKELLESGFTVRGTVRNSGKEKAVLEAMRKNQVKTEHLEFFTVDLNSDEGGMRR